MKVVGNRKAVVIQDEFALTKSTDIAWGMTTDATIQIINPRQAELSLGGQKMTAKILSPANAAFTVESAQQAAPQKQNLGVSRLMAKVPATTGNVVVLILLAPQWPGGAFDYTGGVTPLANW